MAWDNGQTGQQTLSGLNRNSKRAHEKELAKREIDEQKVMVGDNTRKDDTSEDEELTWATTKHNVMIKIVNADAMLYTNQTVRFPIQSSKGNTSLMCTFDSPYATILMCR